MSNYKKNKNWNIFVEDNKLFLTKGADEIYYMDDIDEENVNEVYKAYSNDEFEKINQEILNKFEQAGVIYKCLKEVKSKIKVAFKYIGEINTNLNKSISDFISKRENIVIIDNIEECDLLLIIRTNADLKEVLQDYEKIKVPHLFCDLAYANTISLGPIVYKNETACLGCFIGRITKNWGDPVPPKEPQVLMKNELIASLILEKIQEFFNMGNCPDLINGVWSFKLDNFTTKLDKVYKLPWCPLCNESGENESIKFTW